MQLILIAFLFITSLSPQQDVEEVILEKAYEQISAQFDAERYRFDISPRWIPGSILKLKVENIQAVTTNESIQKYTNFEVVYWQNKSLERTEIQLKIESEMKVPVAARRLLNGDTISEDDLKMSWMSVELGRENSPSNIHSLIGKTLTRTINAGQIIENNMLSSEYVVKAGDSISMAYSANGIQITLGCEARQSGAVKDEIQIYCKETRTKYTGRIMGPGATEWVKTQ